MIRQKAGKTQIGHEKDFHWRGGDVSRVEGFSDAVFAFAITLLVVSLEVPDSFEELARTMRGFVAFGVTFIGIVAIWHAHYKFFRRYGLEDSATIILNAGLLLVVLFYIYPLKFLATMLISYGILQGLLGIDMQANVAFHAGQASQLMLIYSSGFLVIFLVFMMLYIHAYRQRKWLQLNAVECLKTKISIASNAVLASFAVLSILIVLIGGDKSAALAGWVYGFVGPVMTLFGIMSGKRLQKLKAEQGI